MVMSFLMPSEYDAGVEPIKRAEPPEIAIISEAPPTTLTNAGFDSALGEYTVTAETQAQEFDLESLKRAIEIMRRGEFFGARARADIPIVIRGKTTGTELARG